MATKLPFSTNFGLDADGERTLLVDDVNNTITASGAFYFSTAAGVTAGTNAQGQGVLAADVNIITTAANNPSGITLPSAAVGRTVVVLNRTANAINVYPASGASIDFLSTNAPVALAAGKYVSFTPSSSTTWLSTNSLTVDAPTKTGGGASGTWGINVTGTAGSVPWSGVTSTPTTIAGYGITDAPTGTLSALVATDASLTATYANGTSGVGATLTNSGTLAALNIDSTALSVGDRVLVKNQTDTRTNGLYTVTNAGSDSVAWVLTRSVEADTPAELASIVVAIKAGPTNGGKQYTTVFKSTDSISNTTGSSIVFYPLVYSSSDQIESSFKARVKAATTTILSATYNNGSSGSGATLTNNSTLAALTLDSVGLVAGDRVLVKNQTLGNRVQNGIYVVTDPGSDTTPWVLTRSTDGSTPTLLAGCSIPVIQGTVNGGRVFKSNFRSTFTLGSNPVLIDDDIARIINPVTALEIDASRFNYFTKSITTNSTFTIINVSESRAYSLTLRLTITSGSPTVSFGTGFNTVYWPGGVAPTFTNGKTHLIMMVTEDGGLTWRATALTDFAG